MSALDGRSRDRRTIRTGPIEALAPPRAPLSAVVGPVGPWALAAVCGGLAGERLSSAALSWTWLGIGVAALSAAVLLAGRPGGRVRDVACGRPTARAVCAGILATVAVAGVIGGGVGLRLATTQQGALPAMVDAGGQRTLDVVVANEPRPIASGWQVLLTVERVDGIVTRERAAATLERDPPALGQRWTVQASARPLPDGGYGRWLSRQHAIAVLDVGTIEDRGPPGALARSSEFVRARVREAASHHLDDSTGGLLVGFVTGDRRLLPEDDQLAMQATSLTHLTAVSGSHVAILLGGVLAVCSILGLPLRWRWVAMGLVLPWFAFVTRFEPSVSRASTMAGVLLVVAVSGRARDARHALGVALIVLLAIDPRLAGSLGLVLSASAAAGILVATTIIVDRLPNRLPRRLRELTAVTLAAQVAVLPVLLATFGELGLASVPANLLAVPFAAWSASIAFVATLAAVVHVGLGAWVFAAAAPGAQVVLIAAHAFADRGPVIALEHPASVLAASAACVWLLVRRRSRGARWAAAVLVLAVLLATLPLVEGRLPVDEVTLTAIDVGQGDAFLLESPGARILVDAGPDDAAARWLARSGRRSLDLVVVTHPHLDHVGGVPAVMARTEVAAIWAAPLPTSIPEVAQMWRDAAAHDVPVLAAALGDRAQVGDLVIEVLHPPPGRPHRFARSELNDSSYVLRVHTPTGRVLFTGDVEAEGQQALLDRGPEQLHAEVMTVPHHGSATSVPEFLTAVGAHTGLVSAGRDNRHGHPHPSTLQVLEAAGVVVRRTDLEGTVRVPVTTRAPAAARPPPSAWDQTGLERLVAPVTLPP